MTAADTFAHTGVVTHFRGPYADGPPLEALLIDAPRLDHFGLAELRRMAVAGIIILYSVLGALLAWVPRRRGRGLGQAASGGVVRGFERLGPTYVKLGQLIASSPGIFPEPLATACERCLDEVPPFSIDKVYGIITDDLGKSPKQLFRSFDDRPLSAASIAQVHACELLDGRLAVVKVQRPNIHARMNADLRILYVGARAFSLTKLGKQFNAKAIIEDLHEVTNQELNSALEAHRQSGFRDHLWDFGDNDGIYAPEVYWDYCGPRVICMERVSGIPMDETEAILASGVDGEQVLRGAVKAWLEAVLVHGPFHGDLHAGNLWVLDDGRAAFLDFGIMGELTPEYRDAARDMFMSLIIDDDWVRWVKANRRLGVLPADLDVPDEQIAASVKMMLEPMMKASIGSIDLGEMLKLGLDMMQQFGPTAPRELILVFKQILYVERYVKGLAPDYVMISDFWLYKNVFPDEVVRKAAELNVPLDA